MKTWPSKSARNAAYEKMSVAELEKVKEEASAEIRRSQADPRACQEFMEVDQFLKKAIKRDAKLQQQAEADASANAAATRTVALQTARTNARHALGNLGSGGDPEAAKASLAKLSAALDALD